MCSSDTVNIARNESNKIVKVHNYKERMKALKKSVQSFTLDQLLAYNKAIRYLSGEVREQLIMFISGEGGTGKSYVIEVLKEYTRLQFGKQKGLYGAALAMAPTGCAANVIGGYTWQSVFNKAIRKKGESLMNGRYLCPSVAKAVGAKLAGVKLAIIDEISMVDLTSLHEISEWVIEALCSFQSYGLLAFTRNYLIHNPYLNSF
jgi:nucleoside-triphosphatase THEP1